MWSECFYNGIKPVDLFYKSLPSLNNVRLAGLSLDQNGPTMRLRVGLDSYPDNPPKEWVDKRYNKFFMTLSLLAVEKVSVQGWVLDNIGDIDIEMKGDSVQFSFLSGSTMISCLSGFARIEDVSACCVDTEEMIQPS